MTDADFLLALLSDGKPRTTNEILAASFAERGVGLTVHSRAADLRKRGQRIDVTCQGRENGRAVYSYTLLPSLREASPPSPGRDGERNGATADAAPLASRSEGNVAPPGAEPSSACGGSALSLFETPTKPAWA